MSKISRDASDALFDMQNWRRDNTRVAVCDGIATMTLHGNAIAKYDGQAWQVSCAGWATKTTLSRLNALTGVYARIKAGDVVINGKHVGPYDWLTIGGAV